MAAKNEETVVYLIEYQNGDAEKITIPASWKVTFGPLVPGSKAHESNGAICLRVYESKEKQRAVFTKVQSFRMIGIPVERKIVKTQQETFYRDTPQGKKSVVMSGSVEEWKDADEPQKSDANALNMLTVLPDDIYKDD